MKKIDGFQITNLTLSGFKSYAEPTELCFGNPTIITGGNGSGKSSVADAIAFAVTGLPFFGERGIDRLHSESNPDIFVSMRFVDENGSPHELIRTRHKNRMTINYDGYEMRQLDLNEMFGERNVFLSIFNPLYFIEELGEEGKHLLERHLPVIPHDKVLSELSEYTRNALNAYEMHSPQGLIKEKRETVRTLEESIIYLEGQRDLVVFQERDGNLRAAGLEQKLTELTAELEALEEQRFDGIDREKFEAKLVECSAQYKELMQRAGRNNGIGELQARLDMRKQELYTPKYIRPIAEANARLQELALQYRREQQLKTTFVPGMVCPTCRRAVTEDSLEEVTAAIDDALAEICTKGLEQRRRIKELETLEKEGETTFEQIKAEELQKMESELTELREQCQAARNSSELDRLRQEMQAIATVLEYGNLTQEEYERLPVCHGEKLQCESELTALRSVSLKPAGDYAAKIERAKKEIADAKRCITEVALYIAKRAELTFERLTMNKVAFSLYEVVKSTGELKDVFRFTYGGRLYNRLSLSEKIRAGLEVSELIKRLTGRNYPVFADNMESVDDLANIRPTGQVILAKCVSGAKLTVAPKGVPPAARSKAA